MEQSACLCVVQMDCHSQSLTIRRHLQPVRMTDMLEAMTEIVNYDGEEKEMVECYTVGDVYQEAVNRTFSSSIL